MDTGKINDNYTFYDGYEGEAKIVLSFQGNQTVHIWKGYFDDIFDTPPLDGNGWRGFTRDYHQIEGIFSENEKVVELCPAEYLADLLLYKNKDFDFEETTQVVELMISLFENSIENKLVVTAQRI